MFESALFAFLGGQNLVGARYRDFGQFRGKGAVHRICVKEFDIDGKFATGNIFRAVTEILQIWSLRMATRYLVFIMSLSV
ncbi:hypothetical protein WK67_21350 [Burkholderia ubonensis]|uniref:Uncharacterized protein n=1 Tax=Burkholderia ubonensis TaxID=101571 RepID=A0AAU8UII2_9BURK|nr:hypothetical protein WK67_21350 [Burkholderia ubonensis]